MTSVVCGQTFPVTSCWSCARAAIEAKVIARGTVGFSGADLENLVNQAALKAAVDGRDMVTMKELEFAKDKILMGLYNFSAASLLLQVKENVTYFLVSIF